MSVLHGRKYKNGKWYTPIIETRIIIHSKNCATVWDEAIGWEEVDYYLLPHTE
jgi:hypothetical protein